MHNLVQRLVPMLGRAYISVLALPALLLMATCSYGQDKLQATVSRPMSLEDCKATRLMTYQAFCDSSKPYLRGGPGQPDSVGSDGQQCGRKNLTACYGLVHDDTATTNACLQHDINFNQACERIPATDGFGGPLLFAVGNVNESAVTQLISRGADATKGHLVHVAVAGCTKPTVSLAACRRVLETVVRHGADVNDPRTWDRQRPMNTPLLVVGFDAKSEQVLTTLLDLGADINATNDKGCTALNLAYDHNDERRKSVLEQRAAKKGTFCSVRRALEAIPLVFCIFGGCNMH